MTTVLAPPKPYAPVPPAVELLERPSMVLGEQTLASVTEMVCRPIEKGMPPWWKWAFLVSSSFLLLGVFTTTYLISTGVGVWGENSTIGWAFDITNFVWWVGIGHAGTLISAILLLFRQKWRNSINRFAEAMTLFAVACAGIYPAIHIGRAWMAWYFFPIPYSFGVWPEAYSPLWWDFFAISTYATVSLLFWYIGLIPDLASLRDRATTRIRHLVYGVLSLGWRGSQRHWQHYETACLLLAGLATPLVVSVHSIVSFDFATSLIPGWHATFFPPYFVAGAIFSGFAMVITLMIPVRKLFGLEDVITIKHLECMAKVVLTTGMIVGYAYTTEFFAAWYSGNETERFVFINRAFGPYAWAYWIMFSCNVISPQIFWFKKARTSPRVLFTVCILVNIGMWFERFVIIVTSLHRDFLPSSWSYFVPTWVDVGQMLGHMGLFATLLLLFLRYLPMINAAEVKRLLPETAQGGAADTPVADAPGSPGDASDSRDLSLSAKPQVANAFAVLARFAGPTQLLEATEQVHQAGYSSVDTFGPVPVEGMSEALGLMRSRLPRFTLIGALLGFVLGAAGLYYIHFVDYPLIVGGKQPGSWQGFVPIVFETTILLGAFGTVIGLLWLCRLPRLYHSVFRHPAFGKVSDDAFILAINVNDPLFNLNETPALLARLGGTAIAFVEPPHPTLSSQGGEGRVRGGWIIIAVGFAVGLGTLIAVFGWSGRSTELPLEYYLDMKVQPRYRGQSQSAFFADGRAMRMPVVGTVAYGGADYLGSAGSPRLNPELLQAEDDMYRGKEGGKWVKEIPLRVDAALLQRGENRFNIHCAVCHGRTGAGNGITTQHGFVGVANLHQDKYRDMPPGEIFNTVTNGKGLMAAYGPQVRPADRWAIIAWVRVLQRSENARIDDVPEPYRTDLEGKR